MAEIYKKEQFNIEMAGIRMLSTFGPGSIVPTVWNTFAMPLSSSLWEFVKAAQEEVANHPTNPRPTDQFRKYLIKDDRFLSYLRSALNAPNLTFLVQIPTLELERGSVEDDQKREIVPARVFPRWMYSDDRSHELKDYESWERDWTGHSAEVRGNRACRGVCSSDSFVPPKKFVKISEPRNGVSKIVTTPLKQVPLVLICPKGHISDVPWDKYFCMMLDLKRSGSGRPDGKVNLFGYNNCECHCQGNGKHVLTWQENKKGSWATLVCSRCNEHVSLEGIMNLKVMCSGERAWDLAGTPYHRTVIYRPRLENNCNETMRVVITTSNSLYFPNMASTIFLPDVPSPDAHPGVIALNAAFENITAIMPITKEAFINNTSDSVIINGTAVQISQEDKEIFLNGEAGDTQTEDIEEAFRYQEYVQFTGAEVDSDKLIVKDVDVADEIAPFFSSIRNIEKMYISSSMLGFNRLEPVSYQMDANGNIVQGDSTNIFAEDPTSLYAYPACQNQGEGLFFEFNIDSLRSWYDEHKDFLDSRYNAHKDYSEGLNLKLAMKLRANNAPIFYILHTFSHILIKEFEFSCGYPAASLKERIYFSNRMCGILIYTSEGSAGSMGGLAWQGRKDNICELIKRSLRRAYSCSSDPICWENRDNLNYAACFSCSMLPETSCEEMNMGLDRQVLLHDGDMDYPQGFGFFKELL